MTLTEFATLVRAMRKSQKQHKPSYAQTTERRRLENDVDNALVYLLEPELFAFPNEEQEP